MKLVYLQYEASPMIFPNSFVETPGFLSALSLTDIITVRISECKSPFPYRKSQVDPDAEGAKKKHLVWLCNTQTQSWLQIGTREARGHTNWPTHLQWFPPGLLIGHSWTHVIGMLPLRHTDRTAFGNTRFLIPPLFCNSQTGVRACMHMQIQKPRWAHNNHRYNQHVNNPAIETMWFDLSSPGKSAFCALNWQNSFTSINDTQNQKSVINHLTAQWCCHESGGDLVPPSEIFARCVL